MQSTPEAVDFRQVESTAPQLPTSTEVLPPAPRIGPAPERVVTQIPPTMPTTVTPTTRATPAPTQPRRGSGVGQTTGTTTATRQPSTTRRTTSDPVREAVSGEAVNNMMSRARTNRDAKLATQVGWAQFNRKDYGSAAMWFEQAIAWNQDLGEAYYGLALTRFTQGDTSQAEAIAGYRINAHPKMKTLMGDILVRRGMEDYESRQYRKAVQNFNRAGEYRKLSRDEEVIRGWSYYYSRDNESAANIFEALYRQKPDRTSA